MQKLVSVSLAQEMLREQLQNEVANIKQKPEKETKERTLKRKFLPKTHKYYNILENTNLKGIQNYNDKYVELYEMRLAIWDSLNKVIIIDVEPFKDFQFGFTNGKNRLSYKFALCITQPQLQIIYYTNDVELENYTKVKPPVKVERKSLPKTEELLTQFDEESDPQFKPEYDDDDELPF